MTMTGSWSRWFAVGIVAYTIAVGVPPYVSAQQPTTSIDAPLEPKRPNTGLISLNFGVDWASAYYFRGIAQEQSGANFQPYGSLSFKLIENAGPLTALTATPGTWNNWHAGGGTLVDPVDPKFWYESDLYFTLAATLWENVTIGLTYTAYTSPNDSFRAVQELALGVSLNDSKWLGAFALNPSLLVAGEVDGQADAGRPTACTCNSASTPGTLWRRRALTPDDQPPGHAGAQRGQLLRVQDDQESRLWLCAVWAGLLRAGGLYPEELWHLDGQGRSRVLIPWRNAQAAQRQRRVQTDWSDWYRRGVLTVALYMRCRCCRWRFWIAAS